MIILVDIYGDTAWIQIMDGVGIHCHMAVSVPVAQARPAIHEIVKFSRESRPCGDTIRMQIRRVLAQGEFTPDGCDEGIDRVLNEMEVANG